MERKKLIMLIAAGLVALILISILIVGIVDGIWPWDGPKAYGKIFKPKETAPVATQPTEPPTTEPPVIDDESGEGSEGEGDTTQPTSKDPLYAGEPTTGGNDVKEEAETDTGNNSNTGNPGNSGEGDSNGETTGNQDPNADANLPGTKVPGWGN